jgi:hypothetical protein
VAEEDFVGIGLAVAATDAAEAAMLEYSDTKLVAADWNELTADAAAVAMDEALEASDAADDDGCIIVLVVVLNCM